MVKIYQPTYVHHTAKIGKNTKIGAFCDIGRNVEIGTNCVIQCHVTISNRCKIGDNVFIGPNTSLLNDKYPSSEKINPVTVMDNAIIGGGVILLPGITVGKLAVVGAGAVVTKDIPAKEVWYGNPARCAMNRKDFDKLKEQK